MPAPTVTAATPNFGSLNGGATLTLTGTNFTGTTGVTIGGAAATNVTVVSATSITLTAPSGSAGTASVVVTNASGSNTGNTLFFYTGSGTPTDTFIYLKGGRGDGYVPLWTGQYSDALINEKSDPYRDIFPSASTLKISGGLNANEMSIPTDTAIIYSDPITVVPPSYSGGQIQGSVSATVLASTSDEKKHEPPRQFTKILTWRSYLSSNGLWYHFRLADILGVGSLSRDT